ncbi:MAG: hypothetical protein IT461_09860 [Planctomycetes bacterium]|jgi:hypothetical protein|nr:hypothetical protein [Planctomycetota bacterium]
MARQNNRATRATRKLSRFGIGTMLAGLVAAVFGSAWALTRQALPSRATVAGICERIWSSRSTRRIAGLAGAIAVICGFCWMMQRNLRGLPRHQIDPGRVELAANPTWAKPELARRIKEDIESEMRAELAALPASDSFDAELLPKVHAALTRCAWVRRVISISRRFPASADAQAELTPVLEIRSPALCVATSEGWVLVDGDAVRLPLMIRVGPNGKAELEDLCAGLMKPLRVVEGVSGAAPAPGKKWESEEIAAAISMEHVLRDCAMDAVLPIARIYLVGVPQHADTSGRVRYAPGGGVVLLPDAQIMPETKLVWGRPPVHAGTLELSVNDKLAEIKRLLKEPELMQGKAIDLTTRRPS